MSANRTRRLKNNIHCLLMGKMDDHYIKAFLRFVVCCCAPVADTPVFYHLGYNDGLYFGSSFCLVGHSSGCVLDDYSCMVYPFDECSSGLLACGVSVLYPYVGNSQYQHGCLFQLFWSSTSIHPLPIIVIIMAVVHLFWILFPVFSQYTTIITPVILWTIYHLVEHQFKICVHIYNMYVLKPLMRDVISQLLFCDLFLSNFTFSDTFPKGKLSMNRE